MLYQLTITELFQEGVQKGNVSIFASCKQFVLNWYELKGKHFWPLRTTTAAIRLYK